MSITSSDAKIAVEFRDVSFEINHRLLVSKLNLQINQGEALILLGRSGSGKTTTLKLINHLLKPTQGEVSVQGLSTNDWDVIKLRRSIGYVIQETGLFPHFNVAENIGIVPSLEKWPSKKN
ncbi:ABC transporter ATP-binding protein [Raphidiopsis brookii D9]|nr:ABC transporter ATP-binding protein [Raphidiopsis brookii D9]